LQHFAATLVAAGAGDAAAVFGQFAAAIALAQVELAAGDSVLRAAETAKPITGHFAEILKRCASNFIIATAVDLEPACALFEAKFTAR
jgi:hypothetical protein